MAEIFLYISTRPWFFSDFAEVNCSIDNFCACEGANLIEGVNELVNLPLYDSGVGLLFSEVIPLSKLTVTGTYLYASLSEYGMFACYSSDYESVTFTSLISDEEFEVETSSHTMVCFYDDKVIFLTSGDRLKECSFDELRKHRDRTIMKYISENNKVDIDTDVSKVNETRRLYYLAGGVLFEHNVNNHHEFQIDEVTDPLSIGCTTGIFINNAKCILENKTNDLMYLNNDYEVKYIFYKDSSWTFSTFIPSTSSPNDINKGGKIYNNKRLYVNEYHEIKLESSTYTYKRMYTMVRLYRDVFILFDANSSNWLLMRLVIK